MYPTAGTVITEFTDDEYTAIETDLHTYTNVYRNGTGYKDEYYSDATTGLTSSQYSELKKKMLKSVYQNGGFWIGRYEAGIETNRTSHSAIADDLVPTSKANQYPLTYVYCSEAQTLASRVLPSGGSYTSSLMFGVQWDLVLKYLETKGTSQADLKTDSMSWGNCYEASFTISNTNAKYLTYSGSSWALVPTEGYQKSEYSSVLLTTGADVRNSKMNIYDLAGNIWEWTLEYTSNSSNPCAIRGGYYGSNSSFSPASSRGSDFESYGRGTIGARVSLY